MKVSKITIGRLFNLGSYEHVRYEMTVEVKEGESAAAAVIGMERILEGLKPNRCIASDAELKRETLNLDRMHKMTDEEWKREFAYTSGTREEIMARYDEDHVSRTCDSIAAKQCAEKARQLFDDIGGAAEWKDAKLAWDTDDDQD